MPIQLIRPAPAPTLQSMPNGAVIPLAGIQALDDYQTLLCARGIAGSKVGHYHNDQFRPIVGIHTGIFNGNVVVKFFMGVSQISFPILIPPGYNRLYLEWESRLSLLDTSGNNQLGSSLKIDLVQFGSGQVLHRSSYQDAAGLPEGRKKYAALCLLDSMFRMSPTQEARFDLRITYDTSNGDRSKDGQYPSSINNPAFLLTLNPAFWQGLGWINWVLYRDKPC